MLTLFLEGIKTSNISYHKSYSSLLELVECEKSKDKIVIIEYNDKIKSLKEQLNNETDSYKKAEIKHKIVTLKEECANKLKVTKKEDAENMLDRTGADGVMLARGAIANVFLVSELLNSNPTKTLKTFVLEHLDLMSKMYKGKRSALEFRKFLPYYLKGRVGIKDLKIKIQSSESVDEIKSIIEQSNL